MNTVHKDTNGFSLVELLLVLVTLAVIGVAGYFVAKHVDKKTAQPAVAAAVTTTPTTSTPAKTTPTTTANTSQITSGPGTTLDTYTNNSLGFSFTFPVSSINDNGCTQTDSYMSDSVTGPSTYRTTSGLASNTVLASGDDFYIAPQYTYVLTGGKATTIDGQSGYTVYGGCSKTLTTPNLITESLTALASGTNIDISELALIAKTVQPGSSLNSEVQTIFGDNTLKVSKLTADTAGNWDNLSFTCSKEFCANLGGSYTLRYYTSSDLLVFWNTGQACNLMGSTAAINATCYDSQVIASFKLLN
jgi:Tfp pilus assembly protein FimT